MNMNFKRIRSVTRRVLCLRENNPIFIQVQKPIYLGEKLKDDGLEPARLLEVIDLETGEECVVVCPTLMVKELEKNYAENSYVEKFFEISVLAIKEAKGGAKGYRPVQIFEIQTVEAEAEIEAPPKESKNKK